MLAPAVLGVVIPVMTFVLLTAVGSGLGMGDFRRVSRRPLVVVAGLVFPPLVLPGLALALIAGLAPHPPVASGLLLIAICPVGGISNTFTYLAHGSAALSVTLTALSCLLAIVTVPALGAVVQHVGHAPPVARIPAVVLLGQLLATVVLPVSIGMVVRHRWPRFAADHQGTMQRTGFALLGLLLALIILADTRSFVAHVGGAVPVAAAFIACSCLVGGGVGHALGADMQERVALAIEFATRNVAVATLLAITIGRVEFATFATTYFLTELPLMLVAVAAFRALVARAGAAEGPGRVHLDGDSPAPRGG